jgi:hypothetical protein
MFIVGLQIVQVDVALARSRAGAHPQPPLAQTFAIYG